MDRILLLILQMVILCFAFFMLVSFIMAYIIFKKAFRRSETTASANNSIYKEYQDLMKQGADYFFSLNPKEVWITSHDALKLCGMFYENPNSRGTVIFMHGYHGNPFTDFGPVLKHFSDMGFSLLLPYQRAHGKSQGEYLTFGVKESKDCLAWANYLAEKYPGRSIALHGISMGGATVGMASCLDLPKEVKLIANDCGFTSPDAIISSVRKSMKLPYFPFQLIVRLYAKLFATFSLTENDASKCYGKSQIPALFIHGEADDFVPYAMGVENYENSTATDKIMISVKDAGHGLAYIIDPRRVTKELTDFYNKHM